MTSERWRLIWMIGALKLRDEYPMFDHIPLMCTAKGIEWVGLIDHRFISYNNDNRSMK